MPVAEHTETLTPSQYLLAERLAERKSEYLDGELFPMPGVSLEHDRIVGDIFGELRQALKNTRCDVFTADMRVQLSGRRFVYPDVTVVCGTPTFADAEVDTLTNPTVVFEVLSESTLNHDLGEKARLYRQCATLRGLCFVAQDRPWVEVWTREEGNGWHVREFTDLEASAELPALSLGLSLAELYRRVTFPESA